MDKSAELGCGYVKSSSVEGGKKYNYVTRALNEDAEVLLNHLGPKRKRGVTPQTIWALSARADALLNHSGPEPFGPWICRTPRAPAL